MSGWRTGNRNLSMQENVFPGGLPGPSGSLPGGVFLGFFFQACALVGLRVGALMVDRLIGDFDLFRHY